jgi:DNA-directed RNA polymerase subunit RPC12/RpoP
MNVQKIDCSERWLAFKCLICGEQVANFISITDKELKCPKCGSTGLIQLTDDEILFNFDGEKILNPYYVPGVPALGISIIAIFTILFVVALYYILR